jgi:kynurenine 3-monooxygenase
MLSAAKRSRNIPHSDWTIIFPDYSKSILLTRINPAQGVELAPDTIHASNLGNNVRIVLAPQPGDTLHGAFIFNAENSPFDALTSGDQVLDYFAEKLPTFRPLLSQPEAEALLQRPIARLVTVKENSRKEFTN